MNEHVIGAIVVAFLLGLVIGHTAGKAKGFALAAYQHQQDMMQKAMAERFNAMFGKEDENGAG